MLKNFRENSMLQSAISAKIVFASPIAAQMHQLQIDQSLNLQHRFPHLVQGERFVGRDDGPIFSYASWPTLSFWIPLTDSPSATTEDVSSSADTACIGFLTLQMQFVVYPEVEKHRRSTKSEEMRYLYRNQKNTHTSIPNRKTIVDSITQDTSIAKSE
ncbi:hypothetical protein ACHAXS_011270 [Conticribra weissflogii]